MKNMFIGLIALAFVASAHGAALTANRNTPSRGGELVSLNVASNVQIFAGSMVSIDSTGKAIPAADTASTRVIGRAEEYVDNRTAVYSATKRINVTRGIFRWANGDTFTVADIGSFAYVGDDQTAKKAASVTHDIIAGTIVDVDSGGVWVDTFTRGSEGATSLASLAVAGNSAITGEATVGETLTVTGDLSVGADDQLKVTAASGNTTIKGTLTPAGNLSVGADDQFKVTAASGNTVGKGTLHAHGAITSGTTGTHGGMTVKDDADENKFTVDGETGNTAIAGTLVVTGVSTFTAIPKLTETQAADTESGITAVMTNLPAAATADAAWFKVTVGEDNYAVPMFLLP